MITLYIDPNDDNQVMAFYENGPPTDPGPWLGKGFIEVRVSLSHPAAQGLRLHGRNCTFNSDVCAHRVNRVQPDFSRQIAGRETRDANRNSGRARLRAIGLTEDELKALGL